LTESPHLRRQMAHLRYEWQQPAAYASS
jgi:hypothetical protein